MIKAGRGVELAGSTKSCRIVFAEVPICRHKHICARVHHVNLLVICPICKASRIAPRSEAVTGLSAKRISCLLKAPRSSCTILPHSVNQCSRVEPMMRLPVGGGSSISPSRRLLEQPDARAKRLRIISFRTTNDTKPLHNFERQFIVLRNPISHGIRQFWQFSFQIDNGLLSFGLSTRQKGRQVVIHQRGEEKAHQDLACSDSLERLLSLLVGKLSLLPHRSRASLEVR